MAFKKSKQKSQPDLFARDCGKLEGQRGTGDFYTNEKDLLVVRGERIMCVKW